MINPKVYQTFLISCRVFLVSENNPIMQDQANGFTEAMPAYHQYLAAQMGAGSFDEPQQTTDASHPSFPTFLAPTAEESKIA
jgi:hypothetical protein